MRSIGFSRKRRAAVLLLCGLLSPVYAQHRADWMKQARWGANVAGWWFDGCYWPNALYRSCEPPNFESFASAPRFSNEQVIRWSLSVSGQGGAITWDVPVQYTGLVSEPFLRQLSAIHKAFGKEQTE